MEEFSLTDFKNLKQKFMNGNISTIWIKTMETLFIIISAFGFYQIRNILYNADIMQVLFLLESTMLLIFIFLKYLPFFFSIGHKKLSFKSEMFSIFKCVFIFYLYIGYIAFYLQSIYKDLSFSDARLKQLLLIALLTNIFIYLPNFIFNFTKLNSYINNKYRKLRTEFSKTRR